MTRIDFYISDDPAPTSRTRIACRLTEKAYRSGHRVYIHTASPDETLALDDLLWTFRGGSFVPHSTYSDAEPDDPVIIGHGAEPGNEDDLLINLAPAVPAFFSRFNRVAEIVDGAPQTKALARERFRFYRDRGYTLETHHLQPVG